MIQKKMAPFQKKISNGSIPKKPQNLVVTTSLVE
jgi:hypothetical protein